MVKSTNIYFAASLLLAMRINSFFSKADSTEHVVEMTIMEKYEYCVKMITVCHTIWDKPVDYNDIDSGEIMKQDIEKSKCVPKDLTDDEMKLFWDTVHRWEDEVQDILASGDGFTIQEEFNNGRSIRVQLWNVFKLRKVVICHKEIHYEPEGNACDDKKEIGIWINEQIRRKQSIIYLIDRLPNTLQQLILQINNKCCPYAILRDRYEIINDYLDTIMQLKTIEPYERIKSTDYAMVDINNLQTRLQYLDGKTIYGQPFSSNCCKNNWQEEMESLSNNIKTKLIRLLDSNLPTNNLKPLFDSQNKLQNYSNIQFDRLQKVEKLLEKALLTKTEQQSNCCGKLTASIRDIENNINSLKSFKFKFESKKDLVFNNVMITKDNTQFTQSLVNTGQNEIDNLDQKWKIHINSLRTTTDIKLKLNYLEKSKNALSMHIDSMNFNKSFNEQSRKLLVIEDQLQHLLAQPSIREQKPIFRKLITAELKNDRVVKYCMEVINQQREELRKLDAFLFENKNAHLNKELKTDDILSKLFDHLHNLENDVKAKLPTKQTANLKSLENSIQDISKNTEENSVAAKRQFQIIINYQDRLTNNLYIEKEKINHSNNNRKYGVGSKINQQKGNKTYHLNRNEITSLYSKVNEKMYKVKNILNQIKDKHMKGQIIMLQTIDKLETKLNTIIDKSNNVKAAAIKCSVDCNLGELPSIEELINRLNILEGKLRNTKK